MVLTACGRDGTCKLANTNEDREVTQPDQCEAVDETSRSATMMIRGIHMVRQFRFDSLLEANREDAIQD